MPFSVPGTGIKRRPDTLEVPHAAYLAIKRADDVVDKEVTIAVKAPIMMMPMAISMTFTACNELLEFGHKLFHTDSFTLSRIAAHWVKHFMPAERPA